MIPEVILIVVVPHCKLIVLLRAWITLRFLLRDFTSVVSSFSFDSSIWAAAVCILPFI